MGLFLKIGCDRSLGGDLGKTDRLCRRNRFGLFLILSIKEMNKELTL